MKFESHSIVFQEIPNEISLAFNISNCPYRCKGCHSSFLQRDEGDEINEGVIDQVMNQYHRIPLTCICFMGGDRHPDQINKLAVHIRNKYPKMKIGWYSGNYIVSDGVDLTNLDYLKLGPYIESKGGLNSPTTNQKFYTVELGNLSDATYLFWGSGVLM